MSAACGTTVRTGDADLDGFERAYAVTYDTATLHYLTVVADVADGEVVTVSAVAPTAEFDKLDLEKAVGSLSLKAGGS